MGASASRLDRKRLSAAQGWNGSTGEEREGRDGGACGRGSLNLATDALEDDWLPGRLLGKRRRARKLSVSLSEPG